MEQSAIERAPRLIGAQPPRSHANARRDLAGCTQPCAKQPGNARVQPGRYDLPIGLIDGRVEAARQDLAEDRVHIRLHATRDGEERSRSLQLPMVLN